MMPYPIFTKFIIPYFLSKYKSIPKRQNSLTNTIKDDGVQGKLKFVTKGEDKHKYGMSIPDVMMNDDIKDSEAYQTYIALSTGTEVPKKGRGKGKGLMSKKATVTPSKKGSITADDNIILDPDVALKLGESISKTKAEEQEEARRFHETRESLVTKKTSNDEEGILTSNLKEATKASKRSYRIQKQSTSSSKGAGITPEVPDEPKGSSAAHVNDDDCGSDEEAEIFSSDEERIKTEKEVAESEKADEDEQTDDEHYDEEVHEDEEVHDEDEKHDDDKAANEETADENITDDEKDDEEIMDTAKGDEEMIDAEKVDFEKTKEEKVNDDQSKVDKAEDDHVEALISVTRNEKLELPPSTFSFSLSFDYGNQFLNVSSDISLVGTIREPADIEINSLLDVPVQQEITSGQHSPLLSY
ncbi:hypothetical protein Tco_1250054 [Tanacetum coccineum]